MRRLPILLAMLIALSLVTGPVASAWAAAKLMAPMSDSGSDDDGAMEDCQKAAKGQGGGDCPCCDTQSKCPGATDCSKKCGSHVVGFVIPQWPLTPPTSLQVRGLDPPQPPDWAITPPAPPPRA